VSVKGWAVVFEGHRIQADLVAAALEADGLRVEVFGDNAYGVGVDLTEARVMVPEEQAQTARRIISEAEGAQPDAELDPESEIGPEDV
jgi:putative signal transducing protein